MSKVMLVEDDNNLREIYDARLKAEGYEIVSAHDGEEALALAVKERPDLIISDVMMPKISGFDMLDILRSTPETKNTKVIMMTALGQAEDRARADKLGADRYLVKSQVTLEDVIKVAHEILGDSAPATASPAAAPGPAPANVPVVGAPAAVPTPAPAPPAEPKTADLAVVEPPAVPAEPPEPVISMPPTPVTTEPPTTDDATTASIPPKDPTSDAPEVTVIPDAPPTAEPIDNNLTQTKATEANGVEKQIQDFISNNPSITESATPEPPKPAAINIPVTTPPEPSSQDQLSNPSPETGSESVPEPPSHKKLVLQPTDNALAPGVDINALLEKENQKATANDAVTTPATSTIITPQTTDTDAPAAAPNDIAL